MAAPRLHEDCPSHPGVNALEEPVDHGPHECMPDELRCVYCGATLAPVTCTGCGRFMSLKEIHDNESRCDACV